MWKWRELLPVRDVGNVVTLGEWETPLLGCPRIEQRTGAAGLLVKDEGRLPTGSFKARGLVMAVCMAKELGVTRMAMPTNGRSEERRVGKECVSTCRCGWSRYH